jgi:uncharacterized protein (TIGR02996 family)
MKTRQLKQSRTTRDQEALLAAIIEKPNQDTRRLALAALLDKTGDPASCGPRRSGQTEQAQTGD